MNEQSYKNSNKYFDLSFKNTSFASLFFSTICLFFLYIVFNLNFISTISHKFILDGGINFVPKYFAWMLCGFFLFSLSIFLFRKFKWWVGLICFPLLTIFASIIITEAGLSFLDFQNILGTLGQMIDPSVYYDFFVSLPYIYDSLFIYLLLILGIQIIFDVTIGRYKILSLIIIIITIIGVSFLITYQLKKVESLDFVSNYSMEGTGKYKYIMIGEDVKEINNLFEKFSNSLMSMDTFERKNTIQNFEDQFKNQAENLKKETCGSVGFFREPCERLYESAIMTRQNELSALIKFWDR